MGYARILKDNNGKLSGYRECDGEEDKHRVYRKGVLLRDITPEGFHVYNGVYIGNHQVIYAPYGDAKIAHPASFEALAEGNAIRQTISVQLWQR